MFLMLKSHMITTDISFFWYLLGRDLRDPEASTFRLEITNAAGCSIVLHMAH